MAKAACLRANNFLDGKMVSEFALWFPTRDSARRPDTPLSPHWGFWGTFLWSALILIVACVTQMLVTVIEIALSLDGKYTGSGFAAQLQSTAHNGNTIAHAVIATTIVCCSLIAGIIKLKKGSTLTNYLCFYQIPIKTAVLWFGITLLFMLTSFCIIHILKMPIGIRWIFDVYKTVHPAWVLYIALFIATPLFEETFFRGFMFKGIQASFLGPMGAIFITASLWAVIHVQYDFYVIIVVWCIGILLATARQRTGSLWMPLGIHSLYNLCATVQAAIFS